MQACEMPAPEGVEVTGFAGMELAGDDLGARAPREYRLASPCKGPRPRTWVLQEDRGPPAHLTSGQGWTSSSSRDPRFLGREDPPGNGSFHHSCRQRS